MTEEELKKQLEKIIEVCRPKIKEEITGKIILNFNEGRFIRPNFDYSIDIKK